MKHLLILISAALLFVSCGHDDNDTPTPQTIANRTVIVYMSAENNLSLFSARDTVEMLLGTKTLSKDNNLIIYIDRAKELIYNTLNENGIEIPFPQCDVHLVKEE